ncbi:MAG: agmatinase [Solirubrobacteraceae bacterium]|jgi:agmatinase|nr:agmatinase [Solirubrobacteraceae bacterium]
MTAARRAPRYTGVRTFAGLEHVPLDRLPGRTADAVVVGVPFDTATSWRPGARFGPEAIRSASSLLRPWHPVHSVEVFGARTVLDGGDVAITPGNAERSAEQIAEALTPLCESAATAVVLGGDHSILLGELRAHAGAHGPLGLLLFDAHADTWEDYYGERLFHGTVIRRATEEGLLDPQRSLIAGLRGSLYEPADLDDASALGFELVGIDELRQSAPAQFAARARERIGSGAAFLGFDIDVVDPSAAPATGTPEVGGLLAAEALDLLRALAGMRFAGFDVVEVAPPYDPPGQITALLAANIAYEMLALDALGAG